MADTASVPAPVEVEAPTVPEPAPAIEPAPVPAPAPAPAEPTLFDSIDWKNPIPGVTKLAMHLQSLEMMTPKERLTLLQASLLHVVNASSMPDVEKDAARVFVNTMLPHIVESAAAAVQASAKIAAVEKKAEEILMNQPRITVKSIETVIADAAKRKWCCC
jgi:hypothetical protein